MVDVFGTVEVLDMIKIVVLGDFILPMTGQHGKSNNSYEDSNNQTGENGRWDFTVFDWNSQIQSFFDGTNFRAT